MSLPRLHYLCSRSFMIMACAVSTYLWAREDPRALNHLHYSFLFVLRYLPFNGVKAERFNTRGLIPYPLYRPLAPDILMTMYKNSNAYSSVHRNWKWMNNSIWGMLFRPSIWTSTISKSMVAGSTPSIQPSYLFNCIFISACNSHYHCKTFVWKLKVTVFIHCLTLSLKHCIFVHWL